MRYRRWTIAYHRRLLQRAGVETNDICRQNPKISGQKPANHFLLPCSLTKEFWHFRQKTKRYLAQSFRGMNWLKVVAADGFS